MRGWLEFYVILRRYWRAFSGMPPPPQLRRLLESVLRRGSLPFVSNNNKLPLVVVVSELVGYVVGPLELTEGEGGRHDQVQKESMKDTPLPVAPVGDEDAPAHNAEALTLREAPHQLYVVELQGWVEAAALPEQLASQRDTVSSSGGECSFGGL